jgi:hypothetical protein
MESTTVNLYITVNHFPYPEHNYRCNPVYTKNPALQNWEVHANGYWHLVHPVLVPVCRNCAAPVRGFETDPQWSVCPSTNAPSIVDLFGYSSTIL